MHLLELCIGSCPLKRGSAKRGKNPTFLSCSIIFFPRLPTFIILITSAHYSIFFFVLMTSKW